MIHVDALDFSEWHSEEVISFFWRSVYNHVLHNLHEGMDCMQNEYTIKGSMTHLPALQFSMKFLLQMASDIREILSKF